MEKLVKSGGIEYLAHLRTQVVDSEQSAVGVQPLVKCHQHGQPHAGNVVDVGKVQHEPRLACLIHESIERVAYIYQGSFIQRHVAAGEVNDRHMIGVFVALGGAYEFEIHK
jgi:hypothetical protein